MRYLCAIPIILLFALLDVLLWLPLLFFADGDEKWPWSVSFARDVWGLSR